VARPLALPPAVEAPAGRHVGGDPLVEEHDQLVVVDQEVAPDPVLEGEHLDHPLVVLPQELVRGVPLPVDQRVADEHLAGVGRIDALVADSSPRHDRQPVERDPLVDHRRAPLPIPPRLAMAPGDEVGGEALDALWLHRSDRSCTQAVGLDQLRRHHPLRSALAESGAPGDHEPRLSSAAVLLSLLVPETDVREETGQQRLVHPVAVRLVGEWAHLEPDAARDLAQLGVQVLPLAHPQVVEVLGLAHAPERARPALPLLLLEIAPERQVAEEVGVTDIEAPVELGGGLLALARALPRVLDRQPGGDDEDLGDATVLLGLEDHPPEPGVDGKPGQPSADRRQPHLGTGAIRPVEGTELLEEEDAVGDGAGIGRLDEREGGDITEAERCHLQDHRRQVRPEDLRLGEGRPGGEVLLRVEADAGAGRHPPAATRPLVGGRLGDGLDGQPLHLGAAVVPGDPRRPGVDHRDDAGDGERRLGHVRGQHDPTAAMRGEHPVLVGRREAGVQRQQLDLWETEPRQGVGGVADLPLAGEEHEDVARALLRELHDRVAHGLGLIAIVAGVLADRPVAELDGVRATGHLDDRRIVEVGGEPSGVDRG
jgi:hypothetical protein